MAINTGEPAGRNAEYWLRRTVRISAWALLVSVILLVVSGWGITQTGVIYNITFGLVDRLTANTVHRAAVLPLVVFFLTHVLISVRLKVKSTRAYIMRTVDGLLIALGMFVLGVTVYLEYFRLGG